MLGAFGLVASLAACSSGPAGVVVNLYGGASESGFDEIIADCNAKAAGKYTIVGNLLPSDADGQREQFVRRLAARDGGMDLLGMDVTWTAEFAEAGWIRELTPQQVDAANENILPPPIKTAVWKDKQYGIPKHTNVQLLWYRKSLVPTPPKTFDEMISMSEKLKSEGKPYEIGLTAAQYEGYVVNINNLVSLSGGTIVRPSRCFSGSPRRASPARRCRTPRSPRCSRTCRPGGRRSHSTGPTCSPRCARPTRTWYPTSASPPTRRSTPVIRPTPRWAG
jgi:multiple sugar transport system substrate-binding protein